MSSLTLQGKANYYDHICEIVEGLEVCFDNLVIPESRQRKNNFTAELDERVVFLTDSDREDEDEPCEKLNQPVKELIGLFDGYQLSNEDYNTFIVVAAIAIHNTAKFSVDDRLGEDRGLPHV